MNKIKEMKNGDKKFFVSLLEDEVIFDESLLYIYNNYVVPANKNYIYKISDIDSRFSLDNKCQFKLNYDLQIETKHKSLLKDICFKIKDSTFYSAFKYTYKDFEDLFYENTVDKSICEYHRKFSFNFFTNYLETQRRLFKIFFSRKDLIFCLKVIAKYVDYDLDKSRLYKLKYELNFCKRSKEVVKILFDLGVVFVTGFRFNKLNMNGTLRLYFYSTDMLINLLKLENLNTLRLSKFYNKIYDNSVFSLFFKNNLAKILVYYKNDINFLLNNIFNNN